MFNNGRIEALERASADQSTEITELKKKLKQVEGKLATHNLQLQDLDERAPLTKHFVLPDKFMDEHNVDSIVRVVMKKGGVYYDAAVPKNDGQDDSGMNWLVLMHDYPDKIVLFQRVMSKIRAEKAVTYTNNQPQPLFDDKFKWVNGFYKPQFFSGVPVETWSLMWISIWPKDVDHIKQIWPTEDN